MFHDVASYVLRCVRRLAREPAFAISVVVSLTLGISSDAAMFGLVDSLLFRPPPHVAEVDHLVDVAIRTFPDYADLHDQAKTLQSSGAWWAPSSPSLVMHGERSTLARRMLATSSFFTTLRTKPRLGRVYSSDEDVTGGPHLAVLGFDFWQREYHGNASAIGSTLRVAGDVYRVIGVLPEGFNGVVPETVDLYLPLTSTKTDAGREALSSRNYVWLHTIARLRADVSIANASAEINLIHERTSHAAGSQGVDTIAGHDRVAVRTIMAMRRDLVAHSVPVSLWLTLVATIVLAIACANAGGLFIARALSRSRDTAVKIALGASNLTLVREVVVEYLMIGAASGLLSVLVSGWGSSLIRRFILTDLAHAPLVDIRSGLLVAGATFGAVILSALWPVVSMYRANFAHRLQVGGRHSSARDGSMRRALLVTQVALALMLTVGAILFTSSLRNAQNTNLNMSLQDVLVSDLDLAGAGYTPQRARTALGPVLDALRGLPGVRSVAASDAGLGVGWITYSYVVPSSRVSDVPAMSAGFSAVSSDFFATVGTPILRGRGFEPTDVVKQVIIVSAAFARRAWGKENPLGRCIKIGGDAFPCAQVVGVTADRRAAPGDTTSVPEAFVLLSSPAEPQKLAGLFPLSSIMIRISPSAVGLSAAVQRILAASFPDAPSLRVRPGVSLFGPALRNWQLGSTVFLIFGGIAIALAVFGVYSATAYRITQARRDFAIRIAIGSTPVGILLFALRETGIVLSVGIVVGSILTLLGSRTISSFLFGVSPVDPVVYVIAILALTVSVLTASAVPIRHVIRFDAATLLRLE